MFTYTCRDINGCNQYLKQNILHVFERLTALKGKFSVILGKGRIFQTDKKQHSDPEF